MKSIATSVSKLPFFKRGDSNEITINPITFGDFNKLPYAKKESESLTDAELFQQYKAAIFACTDINEGEFATLTAPDFNTLSKDISQFINSSSDALRGEPITGNTFEFDLLHPIENDVGETISRIKFKAPLVAHSEKLADIDDVHEREHFMFRCACGLDEADVDRMSMNDYLAIKPQVGAFFTLTADYFRPTTFKA